jgi:hypothetical protein
MSLGSHYTLKVKSIPEMPEIALEKLQREEDNHSEDGNAPSHLCRRWSTATDRTQMRSNTVGALQA